MPGVVDCYERALRNRERGKMENTAARVRVATMLASGMAATRRLDVMMTNHLRKDPAITAQWLYDSRVQYPKYRKEGGTDSPRQ